MYPFSPTVNVFDIGNCYRIQYCLLLYITEDRSQVVEAVHLPMEDVPLYMVVRLPCMDLVHLCMAVRHQYKMAAVLLTMAHRHPNTRAV